MRKLLFLSALAVLAAGCSDSTAPSVATTLAIAPGSVTLDAVGATQIVHAAVSNQNGKAMNGAAITWSSNSPLVTVAGLGGDSAVVTSTGNGAATVTAQSGDASGTVQVQVTQAAVTLEKVSGDAQLGRVASPLAQPLVVRVRDRLNAPVAGQTVTFTVDAGGGSIAPATVVTGADGTASAVWTLGTGVGIPQNARASVAGSSALSVSFNAISTPGAPTAATAASGNGQSAPQGALVPVAPRVRVSDAFNNPVPGVTVNFAVTSGGGTASGTTAVTDVEGFASVGSWRLGSALGTNTLTATFPGTAVPPVVFTATAVTGISGTISIAAGGYQAAYEGTAVPTSPAVLVRGEGGTPLPGVTVVFTVTSGGGRVSESTAVSNASGVATLGQWVLGPVADYNTLTASVVGLTGPSQTFRGAGCTPGTPAAYEISVCITTPMTAAQRAVFKTSSERWSRVIKGELPNASGSLDANACGLPHPAVNLIYDDLLIFAAVAEIDGPGAVLGQAGPCAYRGTGATQPVIGVMQFDVADLNNLERDNLLSAVILHEMGHVIGIGTAWARFNLLQNPSSPNNVVDTYYSGAGGLAGFNLIGGSTYTLGQKVPVENTGGPGTANGHWRESVLQNELMTGYVNPGNNPMSALTVRSLADMGYTVDTSAADPFSLTLSVRSGTAGAARMHNDLFVGPQFILNGRGRFTRVR